MKKIFLFTPLFILLFMACAQSAMAFGIGVYGAWGMGKGTQSWEVANSSKKYDTSNMKWAGGIVFDSAVAKDTIFNDRLNLGFGVNTRTIDFTTSRRDIKMYDFSLFNTFGFGLARISIMRFWIGPQIGITYSYGDLDFIGKKKYYEVGFLGGMVVGFNFNIGSFFTISLDGGIRYGCVLNYYDIPGNYLITLDPFATAYEGFINVSVLFRFNDQFEEKN